MRNQDHLITALLLARSGREECLSRCLKAKFQLQHQKLSYIRALLRVSFTGVEPNPLPRALVPAIYPVIARSMALAGSYTNVWRGLTIVAQRSGTLNIGSNDNSLRSFRIERLSTTNNEPRTEAPTTEYDSAFPALAMVSGTRLVVPFQSQSRRSRIQGVPKRQVVGILLSARLGDATAG